LHHGRQPKKFDSPMAVFRGLTVGVIVESRG
jgi:hypothetical protein